MDKQPVDKQRGDKQRGDKQPVDKRKTTVEILVSAVLTVSLVVMMVSGVLWLRACLRDYALTRYWDGIAEQRMEIDGVTKADILPRLRALYDENPDIIGWLRFEDSRVSYPVMQTKDEPEYYLRRNFDRVDDEDGAPFADYRCEITPVQGFNTVIYAHNSLFRPLYQYTYTRDGYAQEYYEQHRYFHFDTLTEEGTYEIAACFFVPGTDARLLDPWDPDDEQAYTFYNYLEVDSIFGFGEYVRGIEQQRIFDTGVSLTAQSRIVTLVCCAAEIYSGIPEDGRFVIIGQRTAS